MLMTDAMGVAARNPARLLHQCSAPATMPKVEGKRGMAYSGDGALEQCQEFGVENGKVGKDRRACRLTDIFTVFGSGSNIGLEGNS